MKCHMRDDCVAGRVTGEATKAPRDNKKGLNNGMGATKGTKTVGYPVRAHAETGEKMIKLKRKRRRGRSKVCQPKKKQRGNKVKWRARRE